MGREVSESCVDSLLTEMVSASYPNAPPDMACKDKFLIQSTIVPDGTTDENILPPSMVAKDVDESILVNDEVLRLEQDMVFETVEDAEQSPANDAKLRTAKDAEFEAEEDAKLNPAEDVGSNSIKNVDELNLIKDIEEMKSKLDGLESKLREAEVITISKLTEERRSSVQDIKVLQEKLAELSRRGVRRVQVGFPLLFVCMVALISVVVGYLLHL